MKRQNSPASPSDDRARPMVAPFSARLRPWLLGGTMALMVARPLFPSESVRAYGDGLTLVILWLALAVLWFLAAVGQPKFSIRFGATDAAVLLLVVWHTVAAVWAVRTGSPRPAINMLWEWIGMAIVFFLARQLLTTPRELRAAIAVMIALAAGVAGYGIYQWRWEIPRDQAWYQADPDRALRENDLWNPPGSPGRKLFEDRLKTQTPAATFALSNSLAAFLAPWLVILAAVAVFGGGQSANSPRSLGGDQGEGGSDENRDRPRPTTTGSASKARPENRGPLWGIAACFVLIGVGLLLTRSRGGCIAALLGLLGLGTAWLLARKPGRRLNWKLPSTAAAAVLAAGVAAAAIVGKLDPGAVSRAATSLEFRAQYARSTAEMIAAHPWLGCGPGNFQEAYVQYKLPEASEEIADPHNFLLEIWATAGTPAAAAFLAVLGSFAIATWKAARAIVGSGQDEAASDKSASSTPRKQAPRSDPQSPIRSSDAWLYIVVGGLVGWPLAGLLGLASKAPPSAVAVLWGLPLTAAMLVGLPLAAATLAILTPWVRGRHENRGPEKADSPHLCGDHRFAAVPASGPVRQMRTVPDFPGWWFPAVGVAVLLVALLAAGGIGFPGVAGTLWLLLAVGLFGRPARQWPGWLAGAGLAGALVLLATCYLTAYRPVLGCQAQLDMAQGDPDEAVEHLRAAAAADRFSPEPWERLAAIELAHWARSPASGSLDNFESDMARARRLAPNSASVWLASGDGYWLAASRLGDRGRALRSDILGKAVAAYRQAVSLYPNSAQYRARLAEALLAAGDSPAFRREAKTALQLDYKTRQHVDKRLSEEVRTRLVRGLEKK